MTTIDLIKYVCLFGGTIPNERIDEVREFFDNYHSLQLHKTQVSGSVCLDTELQIKYGDLMQQEKECYDYFKKREIQKKIKAIEVILDIDLVC